MSGVEVAPAVRRVPTGGYGRRQDLVKSLRPETRDPVARRPLWPLAHVRFPELSLASRFEAIE